MRHLPIPFWKILAFWVVQVGTLSVRYYTKHSNLVLDLICKDLGYKRHVMQYEMEYSRYYSRKIGKYFIRNGVLSNLVCPEAAKSFSDCTFEVRKVYQRSCVALVCEPKPGEINLTYITLASTGFCPLVKSYIYYTSFDWILSTC